MRMLRRFLTRRQNLLALAIVLFYVGIAVAAPRISPPAEGGDPAFRTVGNPREKTPRPPSREAPLGTAPRQFDIFHTVVWGARSALRFGLLVTAATALLGVVVGATSGYFGGWVNGLTMRVTDAFLAFPVIAGVWVLELLLLQRAPDGSFPWYQPILERLGLTPLMLALILFSWMPYARLVNANVMHLKEVPFIQAARALGASPWRIIARHLIPNAISPAIVIGARDIGGMVILAAAFTFIGIGSGPEWGTLLVINRDWIIGVGGNPLQYWWTFLPATLALVGFGIGWNLLGDGLNTLLNPRGGR